MENKDFSFEEAITRLEEITARMESGELTLEESMRSYEEGKELIRFCREQLAQAESAIHILTENGEDPDDLS